VHDVNEETPMVSVHELLLFGAFNSNLFTANKNSLKLAQNEAHARMNSNKKAYLALVWLGFSKLPDRRGEQA